MSDRLDTEFRNELDELCAEYAVETELGWIDGDQAIRLTPSGVPESKESV